MDPGSPRVGWAKAEGEGYIVSEFYKDMEMVYRPTLEKDRADANRYRAMVGRCPFAETDPCWDSKELLDEACDNLLSAQLERWYDPQGQIIPKEPK